MNVLGSSQNAHVERFHAYQVDGGYHLHTNQVRAEDKSLYELLQPIEDASHTRDRKRSPPDSACTRGTRVEVVKKVTTWTADNISAADEPHILWMHGYVGSGKSAVSQEVCDTSERQDRPVASFFFFRNAGDRSKIWRLATTLASQMAEVIPETEPFVRAAVKAKPALLQPEGAGVSLQRRMRCLVYAPFKAALLRGTEVRTSGRLVGPSEDAVQGPKVIASLARGPFLIVLDGLDECDDKDEVQDLIDGMLAFFNDNPFIPLRVFITSRVEQHIQSRLNVPGVRLDNLVDHCSDDDIATFLDVLFKAETRRNPVIQAYVLEHGEWPPPKDRRKLVQHIGGSFIFASTVFKFIMGSTIEWGSPTTPMDRLPLALKMNPGLDRLYTQILARSEHLPHFPDIISTIALLEVPLPTSGIAGLLGISTYEVVNVLVNLQAIIRVPGTDDIPVTLFHTSLRDFLTSQSRSGRFFAHPRQHVRLFFRCLQCELVHRQHEVESFTNRSQRKPAAVYALQNSAAHLNRSSHLFGLAEFDSAIQLCREALGLYPDAPELIQSLGRVTLHRARRTGSLVDIEEAISLNREPLELLPFPHPDRSVSLNNLGLALRDRYKHTGTVADLKEAISLYREALKVQPSHHPNRWNLLHSIGHALLECYQRTRNAVDFEEAISLYREALELSPFPHPDRWSSLRDLGNALLNRYQHTGTVTDLEEAISLHREALELRPSPHPDRALSLRNLTISLHNMCKAIHTHPCLQEAILHCEELFTSHYPVGHKYRLETLDRLAFLLQKRFDATRQAEDLAYIARLNAEARQFSTVTSMA